MFAVLKTGGKQYRVCPGDIILVEKLPGEEGDSIHFDSVLMIGHDGVVKIGAPVVAGASVEAVVRRQTRGDKIIVFKKKRRQGYQRKKGHRQDLTLLTIQTIVMDGMRISAEPKPTFVKAQAVDLQMESLESGSSVIQKAPKTDAPIKSKSVKKSANPVTASEAVMDKDTLVKKDIPKKAVKTTKE